MTERGTRPGARVVPMPGLQRQIGDWLELAARAHTMHALVEVDVTDARRRIREQRARTRQPSSLTAFLIWCLARAIAEDRMFHALRKGRNDLVLFDDVDVATIVERGAGTERMPFPIVIRAAHRKDLIRISREIREAGRGELPYAAGRRFLPLWLHVPAALRRFAWSRWLADPWRRRRLTGTTFVSAVGMFGHGLGWGLPHAQHYTVGVTVGGLHRRPGIVRVEGEERIVPREYLALTLSMDHDVLEGAPAARFALRLKDLLEAGPADDALAVGTPVAGVAVA
jgi:pyruvate/2-oxoglutarate dehydrogenase complex dihydrolipoamide acyltransferase (E2) component